MSEMIVPGTYIDVRAEGLISAGRIATGVVAVVGTAAGGPLNTPVTLAGFGQARELFGAADPLGSPADGANPLTLTRALELAYGNGASTVIAVRVAGTSAASAALAIPDAQGRTVATLAARSPGTAGNNLRAQVTAASEPCRIERESYSASFDRLTYARVAPSAQNQIRVIRGQSRRTDLPTLVYKRVVSDERVAPTQAEGGQRRYFLANGPVAIDAPALFAVRVLAPDGAEARAYGPGAILLGAGGPPGAGEVRLVNNADRSEILFAAGELPAADQRVVATYATDHVAPRPGEVLLTTWDGTLTFPAGEAPVAAAGDRMLATYMVEPGSCAQVSISLGQTVERYTVPDGRVLAERVSAGSRLATATAHAANGARRPGEGLDSYFGTGSNARGDDGADAGPEAFALGLESIATTLVNIVVLAGQDAATMGATLAGHLAATAASDFERIGVIGAAGRDTAAFLGHTLANERVVIVAPGVRYPDGSTLPAGYTAAAVAGLLGALPIQSSPTNKTLNLPGLAVRFNRGEQEQLIGRDVLAVVERDGLRVLKGVTSAGQGTPFSQITTRRIVDYAKYGVRSAANPYIGRLNNTRVRAALKSTLDAFLTRMVESEALTGYELEVSATRAQEIAGEVSVAMVLRPTFSIDYIRVVMNLQ